MNEYENPSRTTFRKNTYIDVSGQMCIEYIAPKLDLENWDRIRSYILPDENKLLLLLK